MVATENANGHVPKLMYIDAVLPDTTGRKSDGIKKDVLFNPSHMLFWLSQSGP